MPEDFSQEDIDKLLEEALGTPGSSLGEDEEEEEGAAPDATLDELLGEEEEPEPEEKPSPAESMDIDALLSGPLDAEPVEAGEGEEGREEDAAASQDEAGEGVASQDDIDAMFANLGGDAEEAEAQAGAEPEDDGGPQSQADIDALLEQALGTDELEAAEAPAEPEAEEPAPAAAAEAEEVQEAEESETEDSTPQSQSDIDALFAADTESADEQMEQPEDIAAGETDQFQAPPEAEEPAEPQPADMAEKAGEVSGADSGNADIEAMLSEVLGDEEDEASSAATIVTGAAGTAEESGEEGVESESLEALLGAESALPDDSTETPTTERAASVPEDESDIDALLSGGTVGPVAEEPPVEEAPLPPEEAAEPEDILGATPPAAEEVQPAAPEASEASEEPERPRPTIEAPSEEEPGPAPPEPPEADVRSIRESLSLMESGSELESMTGEISGLLGQLSERARRYQNAWQTANQEAQDLKARLRSAERQVTLLKSEKGVMHEELLDTRARLEAAEEEAQALRKEDRNRIASLERELREKESRVSQLEGELETLNKELEEARGDVTSTSVQTRKARFELERAKNDLEAERQERIRIQRALEAREKEYQALMERGAGEASTLFMDELHRLVRRYENELNVRTGAARDALKALERLSTDDANEREVSLVREGLETASGYYEGADELERLSREGNLPGGARSQRGEPASGEVRATKDDFSAALDRLDFEEVRRQASILMTAGKATPGELMRIAYGKSALHDRRMADHLVGLLALLRRLRDAQQELDRSRGAETDESECFYVRLFDLLHALVRAKVIGQGTPEPWDFFLELRGRFSYITSDAQWVAYRDKTLSEV